MKVSAIYDSTTGKASHVYLVSTGAGFTITSETDADFFLDAECTSAQQITEDSTTVLGGTTVYMKLTANKTVTSTAPALTLVSGTADQSGAVYSFTMPSMNVDVTISA